jgi:hypothetical protein
MTTARIDGTRGAEGAPGVHSGLVLAPKGLMASDTV